MSNPSFPSSHSVHCHTAQDYWKNTPNPNGIYLNVAQLLLCHPHGMHKTAIASLDGDLTYETLFVETCRTASALEQRGILPGERVLIALDDDHMQLCTVLGCWAMGAIPVVINPQTPTDHLAHMLNDLSPSLCIVREDREVDAHTLLNNAQATTSLLSIAPLAFLVKDKDWRFQTGDSGWRNFHLCSPDRIQSIQYSSGTTGLPKGVAYNAHGLLTLTRVMMIDFFGIQTDDIIYAIPRTFFSFGLVHNLFNPLCLNATSIRDAQWPTPERILQNIKRYRPTVLLGVPAHFQSLLENADQFPSYTPKLMVSGGAPLPSTLVKHWHDTFGTFLYNAIGAAETPGVIATTYPHNLLECTESSYRVPFTEVRLLDENEQPASLGIPGQAWVHNSFLSMGYWNNPALTAQRFRYDDAGKCWLATGDIFTAGKEGGLRFEGRIDDCFKIKGRWVMPIEVEETVLKRLPTIKNCLLIEGPMKNGLLGTVLFIESDCGPASFDNKMHDALASLESYKHPTCCHVMSHLPTNANGKPDRNMLRQQVPSLLAQHTALPRKA